LHFFGPFGCASGTGMAFPQKNRRMQWTNDARVADGNKEKVGIWKEFSLPLQAS